MTALQKIEALLGQMSRGEKPESTIFIKDGLHMNEEGYQRWSVLLKPILAKAFSKTIQPKQK